MRARVRSRIIVIVSGIVLWSSCAFAQTVRLSWNSCSPQRADSAFAGPGTYTLVESATGVNGGCAGHDSVIMYGPSVNDAWRFDDAGCQAGFLVLSSNSFSKSCPSLRGGSPLAITQVVYDVASESISIRL